jgi:hypothetical protein
VFARRVADAVRRSGNSVVADATAIYYSLIVGSFAPHPGQASHPHPTSPNGRGGPIAVGRGSQPTSTIDRPLRGEGGSPRDLDRLTGMVGWNSVN